jgi:hypothetical protein
MESITNGEEIRGRTLTWGRATSHGHESTDTSPGYYSANKRAVSQSPASSFYHERSLTRATSSEAGTNTRRKHVLIEESPSRAIRNASAGRRHSRTERRIKEFTCSLCPRRFRRQKYLKRHFRSFHTIDRPHACTVCGKKFSRQDNVEAHTRTPVPFKMSSICDDHKSGVIVDSEEELKELVLYEYTPLSSSDIRLLRISPGPFDSALYCSLKVVSLDQVTTTVRDFQALSYAWGSDRPDHVVFLGDLPRSGDDESTIQPREFRSYFVRKSLHQALRHIRLTDDYMWVWVDALCIEQTNKSEKSQQIPNMPDIYSSAWNVIAWLGDDTHLEFDIEAALGLIPDILNLRTLDLVLEGDGASEQMFHSWIAFGRLLQRPWFERRWVIQEVACARQLSVRIGHRILSWLDFADAVDLYLENIGRIRGLYSKSTLSASEPAALDHIESSKAVELMRFSRNVFRMSSNVAVMSRMMDLESLVVAASSFAVSDIRDVVYALLYLAKDRHNAATGGARSLRILRPDYSRNPADIFEHFTRYFIATSNSLDIICRPWASWPRQLHDAEHNGRTLPTWIGLASSGGSGTYRKFVPPETLLGPVGSQLYDASRGVAIRVHTIPQTLKHTLQVDGMVLGLVGSVSTCINGGTLDDKCLQLLGWSGRLKDGVDDRLWRTLVANRSHDGKPTPTWYRRACALALSQLDDSGALDSTAMVADTSQPSTLVDYLKRVQKATEQRKIFRCEDDRSFPQEGPDAIVGIGPEGLSDHGYRYLLVCILFGCSVPVILDCSTPHTRLLGACYIHGYMEGETFIGMSKEDIQRKTRTFRIK